MTDAVGDFPDWRARKPLQPMVLTRRDAVFVAKLLEKLDLLYFYKVISVKVVTENGTGTRTGIRMLIACLTDHDNSVLFR